MKQAKVEQQKFEGAALGESTIRLEPGTYMARSTTELVSERPFAILGISVRTDAYPPDAKLHIYFGPGLVMTVLLSQVMKRKLWVTHLFFAPGTVRIYAESSGAKFPHELELTVNWEAISP